MPRTFRKAKVFPCLLLIVLAASFSLFETQSGAAGPDRSKATDDEVQVVVTTYQGVNTSSRIIATIANPVALASETTSSLMTAPMQPAAAGDIVFSQIYASGGNPGSTFQNNFIEVFNKTANVVDISGWRFYITDATGPFNQAISFVSTRGIGIGAGRYLLIQFGPPSANGAPLPTPDFIVPSDPIIVPGFPPIPPVNLSPSGKVFLIPSSTNLFGTTCPLPNSEIVDFVGYGSTANCFEGGGPAPTLSSTTAALRQTNGCTDTDNNNADFLAGVPNPRNSGSTPNFCSTAPPEVQFMQQSLDVTEQSGSIGVLVVRNGNTSGASTVDYTTTD